MSVFAISQETCEYNQVCAAETFRAHVGYGNYSKSETAATVGTCWEAAAPDQGIDGGEQENFKKHVMENDNKVIQSQGQLHWQSSTGTSCLSRRLSRMQRRSPSRSRMLVK